jgi:hypothetical protein
VLAWVFQATVIASERVTEIDLEHVPRSSRTSKVDGGLQAYIRVLLECDDRRACVRRA